MSDTTTTEPDILELANDPELLAIAGRQRKSHIGRLMSNVIEEQSADVAYLINALRSLVQQNHDLRADEGELRYAVCRVYVGGVRDYTAEEFSRLQDAQAAVAEIRLLDSEYRHLPEAYEIVAVRRRVVQTVGV